MSTTTAPRHDRTAAEVSAAGLDALVGALGVADAARFLQQVGPGLGDYTAERDAFVSDLTMDDVLRLAAADGRRPDEASPHATAAADRERLSD